MPPHVIEVSGWLPAIIFPDATLIQLIAIVRRRSVKGVSPLTWILFGIANIAVYIYTEKYFVLQTIIGFLSTAALDFIIAAIVLWRREPQK